MTKLSGVHGSSAAGLPRGRSSLTPAETREAQRRRLVRAAITVFAERGYVAATISDIVAGARVSRQVFYELFETKEDCFLAAEAMGRATLIGKLSEALTSPQTSGENWLRLAVHNYLRICAEEPHFARAWIVEFPNASPRTLQRRNAYFVELSALLKQGHALARERDPETWTELPDACYEAAIGGAHELIFRAVSQERYEALPALEEPIMAYLQALLSIRRQPDLPRR